MPVKTVTDNDGRTFQIEWEIRPNAPLIPDTFKDGQTLFYVPGNDGIYWGVNGIAVEHAAKEEEGEVPSEVAGTNDHQRLRDYLEGDSRTSVEVIGHF